MSEQIEQIFLDYKNIFLTRQDEIRKFLLNYFEKILKEQLVEDVQRIDSTYRIKMAGFQKDLSGWKNAYNNIIISSCDVIKGKQTRYDYKFLFVEEKLDDKTIEIIQNAMDECSKLKLSFQFDDAVLKIDEMIELIRKEEDKVFNTRLFNARKEILDAKQKYEDGLEQIAKLEDRIKENTKNGDLVTVAKDCEKIIEIAGSIKKGDIKRKYIKILEQTQKEIEGLKEIAKLDKRLKLNRTNKKFEAALANCEKIIEIAKSINKDKIVEEYSQIKEELEKEIELERQRNKEAYEKIAKLEENIEKNREAGDLKAVLKDYEEILEIARSIKNFDLIGKYKKIINQIKKDINALDQINRLEKRFEQNKKDGKVKEAISACLKIIRLAESIGRNDLVEKYSKFKDEIKNEIKSAKTQYDKFVKELAALEKRFEKNQEEGDLKAAMLNCEKIIDLAESIDKTDLVKKYQKIYKDLLIKIEELEAVDSEKLKLREELKEKAREIQKIVEIEDDVLPLIEEFSVEDILGDISGHINESLELIDALLDEHRVEVKEEAKNKTVLKSATGEVSETEKEIDISKTGEDDKANYSFQSGFVNPFDDVIEEAIITDVIPYNFEIVNVQLNGKPVEELPDKSLTEDGLELNWKLENIQPNEKVDINYDLRKRISRTIIFILEGKLKIVKTHSQLSALEIEGFYEAKMPFTNSFESVLDGVIVEDIIPLYYINFIKEPTHILPADVSSSNQGELVKWNVGKMESETLNYHYKLLELFKFEELKILIQKLNKEALGALHDDQIKNSFEKFGEIKNLLKNYIE